MKSSRRMKRMSRSRRTITKLSLTSLMDVFTILVFFLLVNSGESDALQTPKQVTLPESTVQAKPRETVVIFVTKDEVVVQGKPVATVADIAAAHGLVQPIADSLAALKKNVIGVNTETVAQSKEVTILADKSVPFNVVKKVMSSCTSQGYSQISLAVIQKQADTTTQVNTTQTSR